jgi:phosphoribosylformimino-5-aminoimidazole carboxamide ribotide isomerase
MIEASGFELLPAIDLRGGHVVRLRQGDFARETAYSDDPVEVAIGFAAAGARWLHVVDLDGARTGTSSNGIALAAILAAVGERTLVEAAGGRRTLVEAAGGLRDEGAVAAMLASGAARAVVGTAALRDPEFVRRLVSTYGANRIAVAIDVRDGRAVGQGWARDAASVDAAHAIERLADAGVTTFEVTAIDRDGQLEGPDVALYERLVELGRGSIVASGGIASIQDLLAVRRLGCAGAIVGRAIYEGQLDLVEALAVDAPPA